MRGPRDYICHALDHFKNFEELERRIKVLSPYVGCFKVGLEAHTIFGVKIIDEILKQNSKVFLDLKFHDIPATVNKAVYRATELGVHYLNVHTLGGKRMLDAARDGLLKAHNPQNAKLIGVTILTSHSEDELMSDLKINNNLKDQATHLAQMASNSNLDGIVCAPTDLEFLKKHLPNDFFYITPGIRSFGESHDQTRISTPKSAIQNGSSLLVIGRDISGVSEEEGIERAKAILKEITPYV